LTSELKLPPESDNESIADYADGMGDAGMEEDGSFIGKYNPRRDEKSSLGATLV